MTPKFQKPSRKRREEPPGLDAFAAGAPPALGASTPSAPAPPASEAPLANDPAEESETHGMNVRFTASEKATIERLAAREERSQHQIIKRLLRPVLEGARTSLDG
jgi:hypothetical protein